MNPKYLIALVFHLLFMPGAVLGYFFAVYDPNQETDIVQALLTLTILIFISELIVWFDFVKFRFTKHYSENQYLIRRLLRSFFTMGATFGVMFASSFTEVGGGIMILYYLLITPLKFRFKQFTAH
ncbi:hypothetical protein [Pseudotenacibaculum haliotis]|uniref:Uncharacterized protein n=1 Tax=Pseudotenacibaculum haliotis TaxID=1862138 RepID=A0ABW5LRX2_9FLAO